MNSGEGGCLSVVVGGLVLAAILFCCKGCIYSANVEASRGPHKVVVASSNNKPLSAVTYSDNSSSTIGGTDPISQLSAGVEAAGRQADKVLDSKLMADYRQMDAELIAGSKKRLDAELDRVGGDIATAKAKIRQLTRLRSDLDAATAKFDSVVARLEEHEKLVKKALKDIELSDLLR